MQTKKILFIIFLISISFVSFKWSKAADLSTADLQDLINKLQAQLIQVQAQLAQKEGEQATSTQTNCHKGLNFTWDYCTSDCKCNAGEGDCDGDFHCNTGYCALDVGLKYGKDRWTDVCEERALVKKPAVAAATTTAVSQDKPTIEVANTETKKPTIQEGSLTISLAEDTSLFQTVLPGTNNVDLLKAKIDAGENEDVQINYLKICFLEDVNNSNSNIKSDNISNLTLYLDSLTEGIKQKDFYQGCALFENLNLVLPKSSSKILSFKGDVLGSPASFFARIDSGDISGKGMQSTSSSLSLLGQAVGNFVNLAKGDSPFASLFDFSLSSKASVGDSNVSVLKFKIYNPLAEKISVEEISLLLEGEANPEDFGAISWKIDQNLLGKSYFNTIGNIKGYTSIYNLPVYENGKRVKPPLFEIASSSEKIVEVLADVKSTALPGKTFKFSLSKDLNIILSNNGAIVGFPLESRKMIFISTGCADTDGGINEYVLGMTIIGDEYHKDACFLGDNLKEWACTSGGIETYKLIECPYGCLDGVCKKLGGNDSSTGVVCIDSDNGKDYVNSGHVKHGDGTIYEFDSCETETTLKENYCDNGYWAQETTKCEKGCKEGACIVEDEMLNIANSVASISDAISKLIERFKNLISK